MNTPNPAVMALQADAISALSGYLDAPEGERTERLKRAASLFVQVREHFLTKEGDPDWKGQTGDYRDWVRDTMTRAGIPNEAVKTVQDAIRWHTAYFVRELLTPEQLDTLGLKRETPAERSLAKRERVNAKLSLVGGQDEIHHADDVLAALRVVENTLRRISRLAVQSLKGKEKAEAVNAIRSVCDLADDLHTDTHAG